jgi:L-threonylcarbamoyladenylate synthase
VSSVRVLNSGQIAEAVDVLRSGGLLGLPTETVYGLAAIATNENAVRRIYEVKGRPLDHPVIVHIGSVSELDEWGIDISDQARTLAEKFWPGPLTLIVKRKQIAGDWLTGGQDTIALRMPSHPVALGILRELKTGVAAPSANRFGSVSPTSALHVVSDLMDYLDSSRDAVLDGGNCEVGVESTIVNCTLSHPKVLRPGAISQSDIDEALKSTSTNEEIAEIKAPGLLASHYAPNARVLLAESEADVNELLERVSEKNFVGFIAPEKLRTPDGCIRLAMPQNNSDYAQILYEALREADNQGLQNVIAVLPQGDDIAVAIRDRLTKAAN